MCTVSGATMNPWENYKILKKILITNFCVCTKLNNKALNKNCFVDMYIYIFSFMLQVITSFFHYM